MKDEEMAEEIANKRCHEIMCYGHCSFNSPKHHRCGEWHREYNCALAGLKAGRPQWHDLRKDPNDLPKDNDEKLCFYEKGKVVARYDSEYGCWETYFNNLETVILSSVIIAWYEVPTFDKE